MIDRNRYESLADALRSVDDLDEVQRALVREQAIRATVLETGEPYEIVAETMDAMISMGDEAVLGLTEGEPTSLRAGLEAWLKGLAARYPGGMHTDSVEVELETLLAYSWPIASPPQEALALAVEFPEDDEHMVITLGGQEVATATYDGCGWSGMEAVQRTAEKVHAAILGKLADVASQG